eukprot:1141767-Pelagomonas_calceolata.AAC.4
MLVVAHSFDHFQVKAIRSSVPGTSGGIITTQGGFRSARGLHAAPGKNNLIRWWPALLLRTHCIVQLHGCCHLLEISPLSWTTKEWKELQQFVVHKHATARCMVSPCTLIIAPVVIEIATHCSVQVPFHRCSSPCPTAQTLAHSELLLPLNRPCGHALLPPG